MRYTKIVQVKVTDEQFNLIVEKAREVGLPRTAFIRFIVLNNLRLNPEVATA